MPTVVTIRKDGSRRVSLVCKRKTRVKQSFKDQCDVNEILKRYAATGLLPSVNSRPPFYGDVSNVTDYRQALDSVIEAKASFAELPLSIRSRFSDDPSLFLSFVTNPQNEDECVRLGLFVRPAAAVAVSAPVVHTAAVAPTPKEAGK